MMKTTLVTALAVFAGYASLIAFVMLSFTITFMVLGSEGTFRPGTFELQNQWVVTSLFLLTLGTIIAGFVSRLISRNWIAPSILSVLMLTGTFFDGMTQSEKRKQPLIERKGEVELMGIAEKSIQPAWSGFAAPIIVVIGCFTGALLVRAKKAEPIR